MTLRRAVLEAVVRDNTKSGIRSATGNVGDLEKAFERATKEQERLRKGAGGVAAAAAKIERRYDPLSAATRRASQDTQDLRRAYEQGAISASRFAATQKNIDARVEATKRRIDGQRRSVQQLGTAYRSATGLVVGFGAAMATVATVTISAGFEQQMSAVSAVTQSTTSQLERMTDVAQELGATTAFTGRQSAEGMEYLARAGFDVNQVIDAIPGNLSLAAAGALELGKAADISSNVLSAFKLEASEMNRVADVMALTAASANTNVEQLGHALSFVAGPARAAGLSLESTTAAIGVLSDVGLQGDRAGTGLRIMLEKLANPSEALSEKMNGLAFTGDNLVEVLGALEASGIGFSEAMTLFGARGGNAALELISSVDKLAAKTKSAVEDATGTASRLQEVMTDNLAGASKRLASAAQNIAIEIGRGGLLDGGTELVDSIAGVLRSSEVTTAANQMGAAIGGALSAIANNGDTVAASMQAATVALTAFAAVKIAGTVAASATLTAHFARLGVVLGAINFASVGASLTTLGGAATAASVGMAALGRASLAFIANPIGAALLAGAAAFATFQAASRRAAENLERDVDAISDAFSGMGIADGIAAEQARSIAQLDEFRDLVRIRQKQLVDELKASRQQTFEFTAPGSFSTPTGPTVAPQEMRALEKQGAERAAQDVVAVTQALNEGEEAIKRWSTAILDWGTTTEQEARRATELEEKLERQADQMDDVVRAAKARNAALSKGSDHVRLLELEVELRSDIEDADEALIKSAAKRLLAEEKLADAILQQRREKESLEAIRSRETTAAENHEFLLDGLKISEAEHEIRQRILELKRESVLLTTEEAEIIAGQERSRMAELDAHKEVYAEARKAAESQSDYFDDSFDSLSNIMMDVWRSFTEEGRDAFDVLTDVGRRWADDVMQSLFDGLFSGDLFGGGGQGGWGGVIQNIVGGGVGASGSGTLGALTAGATSFIGAGVSGIGLSQNIAASFAPQANQTNQLVGGGIGAIGGAIGGSMLASSALGTILSASTGVGAGIATGAAAGSIVPVIGTIVGAMLGVFAGSLFGKSSDNHARAILDSSGSIIHESNKNSDNVEARDVFVDSIQQTSDALLSILGGTQSGQLTVQVDSRDGFKFLSETGSADDGRFKDENVIFTTTDAEEALSFALQQVIDTMEGGDPILQAFASSALDAGRSVEAVTEGMETIQSAMALAEPALSAYEQQIAQINSAFDAADAQTVGLGGPEEFGLDTGRSDALAAVAQDFDDALADVNRALDGQEVVQAFALAEEQQQRLADAIAVSTSEADKLIRIAEVTATNQREWAAFIDTAASSPEALAAATAALNDLILAAEDMDLDVEALQAQIDTSLETLASSVNEGAEQRLLELTSPVQAQFNSLVDQLTDYTNSARDAGANMTAVMRVAALEVENFLGGLTDEQRAELAGTSEILNEQLGRLASATVEYRDSVREITQATQDQLEAQQEIVSSLDSLNASLPDALGAFQREYLGAAPIDQLALDNAAFEGALSTFLDTTQSEEDRLAAGNTLAGLSQDVGNGVREAYGVGTGGTAFLLSVEQGLQRAVEAGLEFQTDEERQLAELESSVEALERIEEILSDPDPRLDELAIQTGLLGESFAAQSALLDEIQELTLATQDAAEVDLDALLQQLADGQLEANNANLTLAELIQQQTADTDENAEDLIETTVDTTEDIITALTGLAIIQNQGNDILNRLYTLQREGVGA